MKKFFSVMGAVLLVCSFWGTTFADFDDGLVLYLPFDKPPVANVVTDESGSGNNGTLSGASFMANGGLLGGAYQFDGIDDFIKIPKSSSLNVGAGEGFTLSAWYNTSFNSYVNEQSPLLEWSPGFQGSPGKAGVHMWVNTQGFQWHPAQNPQGGGSGANLVAAGVPFPDNEWNYVISAADRPRNEWHHVAVTYDRTAGLARVYMDGDLAQERAFAITPDTDYDIYLGTRPTDYQRLLGLLDEVRVYNRALSSAQIQSMYDAVNLGHVYQDFEGSGPSGWTWDPAHVNVDFSSEQVHSGTRSWKVVSSVQEGGTGIPSQTQLWHFDAQPNRHDRLTFWILPDPSNNEPNNVSVKFFDHGNYNTNGFEVWTTKTAQKGGWNQLTVLFTQLPADFNLADIDKIEFKNYWPGTYYLDDIQVVASDRIYQAFENDREYQTNNPKTCSAQDPASAGNCGWAWFGTVAVDDQVVNEGQQSWRLDLNDFWGGTGIRSQEKRLCMPGQCLDVTGTNPQQTSWHVDLNPDHLLSLGYDRLTFWLYAQGENGMDNNMGVQFFDWGAYHADPIPSGFYDKQVIWARQGAVDGKWTQLSVPLKRLPADFQLTDINKLQFQSYWPGTYYLDGIKAAKPRPVVDQALLPTGVVRWSRAFEAAQYTLQESAVGPDGPWQTIYTGTSNSLTLAHLAPSWLRVRWESGSQGTNIAPYSSDWSEVANYVPQPVLIHHAVLQQGLIELQPIAQADFYQVEEGITRNGPWTEIYQGNVPSVPLMATLDRWYRARAIITDASGQITDAAAWSPALLYDTDAFVKAVGTVLKEQNGLGNAVTLRGVNLGNALLMEPWMFFGLNHPAVKKPTDPNYDPSVAIHDDWMFRDQLTQRFGSQTVVELLRLYQETYLQAIDFDNLMRMGLNVVRLPIYYRDIRELDENLDWVGTEYQFDHIDRLIQLCADRGLYVLLDLHGAPGAQSEQDNTGRMNFNQLFKEDQQVMCSGENVTVGECYRRRTVDLWQAIAARYQTNITVVGYDLLNEPAGAPSPAILWQLYDRLYDVIRSIDSNHLIVMEGLWVDQTRWPTVTSDWDWLPDPKSYNWTNIAYQFHYYCWSCAAGPTPVPVATQITSQQSFLDGKFAAADSKQFDYDVPLMIGEFTGFGVRPVWEDYLNRFNQHGWSWINWSYKTYDSPSEWGLYTHLIFAEDLPDARTDSLAEIQRKLSLFDTANHHTPNVSLVEIFETYAVQPVNQPPVLNAIGAKIVNEGQLLTFTLAAFDPQTEALTYSASSLPIGASFDPITRKFNWTPGFNQAGSYPVKFVVSDGILKDQETVTITVNNAGLCLTNVGDTVDPFSPNGDGRKETTALKATLNHTASWTMQVKTGSGTVIRTFSGSGTSVNQTWDGKNSSGVLAADGTYTYVVTATDVGGSTTWGSSQVTVDTVVPVVSGLGDNPDPFRPSTAQTTTISFSLSEPAYVTLQVYNSSGTLVRTLLSNSYKTTLSNNVVWNGKSNSGTLVPAGTYTYKLLVEDKAQNRSTPYPISGTVTSI
jgi:flagellar hook assembly protein FlgD